MPALQTDVRPIASFTSPPPWNKSLAAHRAPRLGDTPVLVAREAYDIDLPPLDDWESDNESLAPFDDMILAALRARTQDTDQEPAEGPDRLVRLGAPVEPKVKLPEWYNDPISRKGFGPATDKKALKIVTSKYSRFSPFDCDIIITEAPKYLQSSRASEGRCTEDLDIIEEKDKARKLALERIPSTPSLGSSGLPTPLEAPVVTPPLTPGVDISFMQCPGKRPALTRGPAIRPPSPNMLNMMELTLADLPELIGGELMPPWLI